MFRKWLMEKHDATVNNVNKDNKIRYYLVMDKVEHKQVFLSGLIAECCEAGVYSTASPTFHNTLLRDAVFRPQPL